jgi:DNA replication and repair protein RecF
VSSCFLEKIKVTNFRNLESQYIDFSSNINCIIGNNGNGKTNILEAIYYLLRKKSFRKNNSFPQLLSADCSKAEIIFESLFRIDNEHRTISLKNTETEITYSENSIPVKKIKPVPVIFINPFDSYQFFNSNSFSRDWFDDHICLVSPAYKKNLSKFKTILKFRNTLLQEKPNRYELQIKALDQEFVVLNLNIINERKLFITNIQNHFQNSYSTIFGEKHLLGISYESKFSRISEEEIRKTLSENLQKDSYAGRTSTGIHLDNYEVSFDGFKASEYCSLGQLKIAYFSLLFAYIDYFRYNLTSLTPIVLIDDISGELDRGRWEGLVKYLRSAQFQVILTTANEQFKDELEKISGINKLIMIKGFVSKI